MRIQAYECPRQAVSRAIRTDIEMKTLLTRGGLAMDERQLLMNDAPAPPLKKKREEPIRGIKNDPGFQRQLRLGSDRPYPAKIS